MFDISWGELFVVGAVGATLAGRKDLPAACRFLGSQIGRVVGLLQGARARADRYTAHHELKQLQNELRSGLRELDQVKTELAVASTLGRTLGATTPSANRLTGVKPASTATKNTASVATKPSLSKPTPLESSFESQPINHFAESLSPAIQSERATMEEEWEKQGIGFKSKAEQGLWMSGGDSVSTNRIEGTPEARTGSELLDNLIKQSLIFDQYDRVVGEQENEMQQRVERITEKKQQERKKRK